MNKVNAVIGACILGIFVMKFNTNAANEELVPVKGFELQRYLGTWYEIARLPTWFENNLIKVTATYELKPNGMVKVINQGWDGKKNKQNKAIGKAKIAGAPDVGFLKVSFFGPFYADYKILILDKDYTYAMVASSKKYLWILSRQSTLPNYTLQTLVKYAENLGFPVDKLFYTPQ